MQTLGPSGTLLIERLLCPYLPWDLQVVCMTEQDKELTRFPYM